MDVTAPAKDARSDQEPSEAASLGEAEDYDRIVRRSTGHHQEKVLIARRASCAVSRFEGRSTIERSRIFAQRVPYFSVGRAVVPRCRNGHLSPILRSRWIAPVTRCIANGYCWPTITP